MLLAHVQLCVHQDSQILSYRSTFQLVGHQHLCGVVPSEVQDFALPLVELHEAAISPFLQLAVPLDSSLPSGSQLSWLMCNYLKLLVLIHVP